MRSWRTAGSGYMATQCACRPRVAPIAWVARPALAQRTRRMLDRARSARERTGNGRDHVRERGPDARRIDRPDRDPVLATAAEAGQPCMRLDARGIGGGDEPVELGPLERRVVERVGGRAQFIFR